MLSDWTLVGLKFGDWLNCVGLALTIVGFWVTIKAARRAEREAKRAANNFYRFRNISKFAELKKSIDSLRMMNRLKMSAEVLIIHYGELARIVSEQKDNLLLEAAEKSFLTAFLQELREFEADLESARFKPNTLDFLAVNQRLSVRFDHLSTIMQRLEMLEGRGP